MATKSLVPLMKGVDDRLSRIETLLPIAAVELYGSDKHSAAIAFALIVKQALADNSKLAACTELSVFRSIMATAAYGLEPNTGLQLAFLIPYKDECTLQIGWRGLVALARREGLVEHVYSFVVYENDLLTEIEEVDPDTNRRRRGYRLDRANGEKGALDKVVAGAVLPGGRVEFEVLDKADILKIKGASKGSPAWKEWEKEMWRKSAVKRLIKGLAPTGRVGRAIAVDDMGMAGKSQASALIIDVPSDDDTEPPRATEAAVSAAEMADLRRRTEEARARAGAGEQMPLDG